MASRKGMERQAEMKVNREQKLKRQTTLDNNDQIKRARNKAAALTSL